VPSTQTLRNWYPELVTGGVDAKWNVIGALKCNYHKCQKVDFLAGGPAYPSGTVTLKFHPATQEAFQALAAVFRSFNYPFKEPAGGTVVCRKITGGRKTSGHAHGFALDINPSTNRYIRTALRGLIQWGKQTDMPKAMVKAAEAIRTNNGKAVFEWGGRWTTIKDAMHWQIRVSQADLATGINWDTVQGTPIEEEEMTIKRGDRGNYIKPYQTSLNNFGAGQGLDPDGIFGALTEAGVKRYQTAAQIPVTGVIDWLTSDLLLRYEEK
jgi:hypothetical protein